MAGKMLYTEETNELVRSKQKLNENQKLSENHIRKTDNQQGVASMSKSYKDLLVGSIPGAYERAFFEEKSEVEMEDQEENRIKDDSEVFFHLPEGMKAKLYEPWKTTLIGKVFGRKVDYNYLNLKIRAMWKPAAPLQILEIGNDFYMFKFEDYSDYAKVLSGGPWFIQEHFLTLRKWEPFFKPSQARLSSIVVWIRFSELPVELYNSVILTQMAAKIGPVLRIDPHTFLGDKGKYARVCIQIDPSKPLIQAIHIGDFKQSILYEGLNKLCFRCGWIGHQQQLCTYGMDEQGTEDSRQNSNGQEDNSIGNLSTDA